MLVQLVGNVVNDATKSTKNKTVINFTIALNYKYIDGAGNLKSLPTFIDCEYWKDSAVSKFIKKGQPISVFGRLYPDAYINRQGEAVGKIRCNISRIDLLTGGNSDQTDKTNDSSTSTEGEAEPVHTLQPADDLPF